MKAALAAAAGPIAARRTQNPGMAASMGINPDRINMLTFGLGSCIAGAPGKRLCLCQIAITI